MSMRAHVPMKSGDVSTSSLTPAPFGVLQRKCACEGSSSQCFECARKENAARQAASLATVNGVPPLVLDVLHKSGQPLDVDTRAFMESRFGHDFSQVRIHTDAASAQSAEVLNARAYTVGRNVVFAADAYRPHSREGRVLIAHELTHVIQQGRSTSHGNLTISQPHDSHERQVDQIANTVVETTINEPSRARLFATSINSQINQATPSSASVARQAATGQRSRIQCINASLANAGIPWAVIALAGGVCGLIGAIGGLATGPGAPAASPSAAAFAAAVCIAGVTGASVGLVLGVITKCIQYPSAEWKFAQNETGGAKASPLGGGLPRSG